MSSFFRVLGFFFMMAVVVLGSLFLFENKLVTQDIVGGILSSSAEHVRDQSISTTTQTLSPKESIPAKTEVSPSSTKGVSDAATKNTLVTHTSKDTKVNKTTVTPTVSAPGPLLAAKSISATSSVVIENIGALNQEDIIVLTNKERIAEGLPPLSFNSHLSAMAAAKANDMIEKQYFAHVSPDGTDVTKLANTYSYPYLNVGENLALGGFTSSADVVSGWMYSPGHRANILDKSYTEIGVSAILGNYDGRHVWYVVQEFGRPLSDCTLPDELLKKKIEIYQGQINALSVSLTNLQAEINTTNLDQETHNAKVGDYNTIVELYNQLVVTVKQDIKLYNSQVETYNTCVKN